MRAPALPVLLASLIAVTAAAAASAHVTRTVGPYEVELGWADEPPLAGVRNAVEVTVTDAGGDPVADLGASAGAEVTFGDQQKLFPLVPSEEPGTFVATVIPTRPGTYELRVEATVDDREITTGATCSEGTFDCVIGASEAQFPVADPSTGELAERLDRSLPRAEQAADDAGGAKTIAVLALVVAALALIGAAAGILRGRHQGGG